MPALGPTFSAVIANGAQDSGAIDLRGQTLVGLYTPAALTGVALTFWACDTLAGTYIQMFDGAGAAISKTVAANRFIPLNPDDFNGVRFLKVRSGSAEGAARTIKLVGRNL